MPTESGKPLIVISYAHEDEPEQPADGEVKWLSFVTGYLRPAIKHGAVELWLDRLMPGGADWQPEIEHKLRACDIFILLVSRHSLSSDYVVDKEIALIRERQAKGEAVHFYPLVLTPTPKIALDLVRDKNLRPRDGKPLSDYPLHERYWPMTDAADEIARIADQIAHKGPKLAARKGRISPRLDSIATFVEKSRSGLGDIRDRDTTENWLAALDEELVVVLAVRAALRLAPILAVENWAANYPGNGFGAFLRVAAMARCRDPNVQDLEAAFDRLTQLELSDSDPSAAVAESTAFAARAAIDRWTLTAHPSRAAARALTSAAQATELEAALKELFETRGEHDLPTNTAGEKAVARMRAEILADEKMGRRSGFVTLNDLPLWTEGGLPDWAMASWNALKAALPESEDWDVWFDWYEQRLRGGSRGKEYELVFASVPREEWEEGPAAANVWIKKHLPTPSGKHHDIADIKDGESLGTWLKGRSPEVAVVITSRASLRTVPLVVYRPRAPDFSHSIAELMGTIYRANALAWVAANLPDHTDEMNTSAFAAANAASTSDAAVASIAADAAHAAAALSAYSRDPDAGEVAKNNGTRAVARAADVIDSAAEVTDVEELTAWAAIRSDIKSIASRGTGATDHLPLWPSGAPKWVTSAWTEVKAALPKDQGWQVWIDWYEQRLRGGSPGEHYELVFANVPEEEWERGPVAANAWIEAHLPQAPELARHAELPAALPNLAAPFSYGWTASYRVAAVPGAQCLPDYRHFSSEEDHRRALEVCRVGGERLLKSVRDGRYNARPEYGEALEYYLDDLPKIAGAGNILLANDQVRILHAMFLADAAMLPEGFASRLKSVIANQFALNAFYDLVQRHNEAVNAGNWTQPFPLDATKSFFGAVGDNTPRWFEREVEQGLRQVEQAEPPAAAPSESAPATVTEPPPLPPGTPDAQDSWKRQMATAANALWETFLQGQNMPVDKDEWRKAADELGEHVRPIIEFLRAQEKPEG
jgi:TIR domain